MAELTEKAVELYSVRRRLKQLKEEAARLSAEFIREVEDTPWMDLKNGDTLTISFADAIGFEVTVREESRSQLNREKATRFLTPAMIKTISTHTKREVIRFRPLGNLTEIFDDE